MSQTTLNDLNDLVQAFVHERDWKQFHNPKDMAISLALEAAELLELTQWKNGAELQQSLEEHRHDLADELADVLFWVLEIADHFQIDLAQAFKDKLVKNAHKYPVEKARGLAKKYTEL